MLSFGERYDVLGNPLQSISEGVVADTDEFNGMSPGFVFDGTRLLVRWGNVVVPGVETGQPEWSEAVIVQMTPDRLTAVRPSGDSGIWVHTIYWRVGAVFSARHSEFAPLSSPDSYTADASLYFSRCVEK